MPEPIKVDFRQKRRPAKAAVKPALRAPSAHNGQKAVNWRALPRFLLLMLALAAFFAAINWIAKAIGS